MDRSDDEQEEMNERDATHAHRYRHLQAEQLLDAYYTGALQHLASELESWHTKYPNIFEAEVQALQRIIQLSIQGIKQLEERKGEK
jgi:hypothetical protein